MAEQSGAPGPKKGSASEESMGRFVVGKIFGLLLAALESRNVIAALTAFTIAFLGWVYALPKEQRIKADPGEVARGLAELLGHGAILFGGWSLSIILITVGGPMFYIQHRRIRTQGREIIKLRQSQDPARLSASDREALARYPSESAKKLGLTPEGQEK